MKPIKENVLQLVTAMPSLLENENELLHAYWVLFDNVNTANQIIKATPAATISRRLRELRNDGLVAKAERQVEEKTITSEFTALG
ncbi:hypothetical protein ACP26L_36090 (plasmid) [Paenibacillus sp. S-38]|uniref:hypothetical protein n=1 Tax=Paenibacillus sp. S-38 TaxID=3416710 RepID=UPI003CF2FADB